MLLPLIFHYMDSSSGNCGRKNEKDEEGKGKEITRHSLQRAKSKKGTLT
jgi:hypothetical protein